MRKLMYVLLGILLVGGAAGTFGVRQLGWDVPSFRQSDRGGHAARSFSRERGGAPWRGEDRRRRGDSWLSFATVLDLLNVIVGVVGIVLTVMGLRMQRNAMQMTMRGRD